MAPIEVIETEAANKPMVDADWPTMKQRFQQFTSPGTASEILRSCLPELASTSRGISDCTIQDARLKTFMKSSSRVKSTLSACYQLTVQEPSTSQDSQRLVYLKAYLNGRSAEVFRCLGHDRHAEQALDQAVTHVPKYDAVIWRFPHDPVLPHLSQLINLQAVGEHLPSEGLSRIGMSGTPHVTASHVVNYRPEIRCTNRYDLYDSIQNRSYQLFGKTFRQNEGRSLCARLQYFWDRSRHDSDAMTVAQPLGYSASANTVWQLGVPGRPLLQILNPSNSDQYIAELARGLASLHTSHVVGLLTHQPVEHIAEVGKKLAKLSDAVPSLAKTCMAMADDLEQTAPQASTIPSCPIHWDFHIQQLLAHQGQLVFCDLDELVLGDPVQDLANFIVDLHFRGLDRQFVRGLATRLYQAYRQQVEWDVPIERLTWHTRLQFINKAYRHYVRFAPGFEGTVEEIIRWAGRGFSL